MPDRRYDHACPAQSCGSAGNVLRGGLVTTDWKTLPPAEVRDRDPTGQLTLCLVTLVPGAWLFPRPRLGLSCPTTLTWRLFLHISRRPAPCPVLIIKERLTISQPKCPWQPGPARRGSRIEVGTHGRNSLVSLSFKVELTPKSLLFAANSRASNGPNTFGTRVSRIQ